MYLLRTWFYCYRQHWLELQSDIYFKVHLKLSCFSCVWDGKFKITSKNWSLSVKEIVCPVKQPSCLCFIKCQNSCSKRTLCGLLWFWSLLLMKDLYFYSHLWMISILTIIFNFIYCEGKTPILKCLNVGCPWLLVKTRTYPYHKNSNMPFLADSWWCHCSTSSLFWPSLIHSTNIALQIGLKSFVIDLFIVGHLGCRL